MVVIASCERPHPTVFKMYSDRPSDPRNQGRDHNTRNWLPARASTSYQSRHHDTTAEYSRDPRLRRGGAGRNTAHVVAAGTSFPPRHGRDASLSHGPPSFSTRPGPIATPQHTNDSFTSRNSIDQESRYPSPSQPPQPRPLFPTATTVDHGHTTGHPTHTSPLPHQQQQVTPHNGNVVMPPPPPPPSWFNSSHPSFPMMIQAPYHQPPMSTLPPFLPAAPTALPPPPTSGTYPFSIMGPLPPPLSSPAAGFPLPFPPPPGGLPPPPLPPASPNFPLPLPIMPPPSLTPRFVPPSLPQTHHTSFDVKGEVPGFKPAPTPVGIEEKLGLRKEQSKVEDEGNREIKRLSSEGDASDRFISEWLERVEGSYLRHQQHKEEMKQNSIKIPEARSLLSRSLELLSSLRSIQHQLIMVPSGNSVLWDSTTEQVNSYKEELLSIRKKFDDGDAVEHLSKKLNKTRAKRSRDRRCVAERRAFLFAREASAEAATEKWLNDRRQEELKAKTEKSVQKAATGVLGDVKRKITDLQRYISLVQALKELRDIRREASRKKGDAPPIEADELFLATHQSAVELLSQQSVVYDQEEHALRVLMEEELNEKMAREERRAARPKVVPVESLPPPMEPHLPPVPFITPSLPPPVEPHPLSFPPPPVPIAAPVAVSVEAHSSIRCEWDHYLSSEGTSLPNDHEAPPSQPSSTQWAEYLQENRTS